MKIAVVGHGPSLVGKSRGRYIDSFDKVVRLKGSKSVLGTPDYGSRTDALCASTEIMGAFIVSKATEYWAYPKRGSFDGRAAINLISVLEEPVMIPLNFCNYWNERFRGMGGKHPNVSTGTAAILISIKRWNPKEICLFGFDTLMNPGTDFDRNAAIPRSGSGDYPDHDWRTENNLLSVIESRYGVDIHAA